MEAIRVQAKFCLVTPDRIFHPAQLVIRHGRVAEVVGGQPHAADVDLGETLLIPGLINAHTHLEFSQLQQPFPAGENFPAWISRVVRYRAAQQGIGEADDSQLAPAKLNHVLHSGLQEAFHSGTTVLADIVTAPWMPRDYPTAQQFVQRSTLGVGEGIAKATIAQISSSLPEEDRRAHLSPISYPRVLPFTELIGLSPERAAASWQWSQSARTAASAELSIGSGTSPHAPYSVHFPTIVAATKTLPPTTPIAMHVAESRDELQWLEHRQGAFGEAFARLGLDSEAVPPSIMVSIELLARFRHSLLIHGNYLNSAQIQRVATAPNIAVVYCPRTHRHFDHAPYPLQALRDAGISVILGTDSRASNPSLSLWDEVHEAARRHPQRDPSEWLRSVTLDAARALGIDDDFGSLQVGRWASAVAMPARASWTAENLFEALCASSAEELQMQPLGHLLRW